MKVIGITGSSGSGKSTVAAHYAALGYPVIDGDGISRELAVPGSPYVKALQQEFGEDICDACGALERRVMVERAFATQEGQRRLTKVTTPLIYAEIQRRIERYRADGETLVFLDGALIIGTPFAAFCDEIIAVLAEPETQIARIVARDKVSKKAAANRLARQPNNQVLQQGATHCLWNLTNKEDLICKAEKLLERPINNLTSID